MSNTTPQAERASRPPIQRRSVTHIEIPIARANANQGAIGNR